MQIEITNEGDNGYNIYIKGNSRPVKNLRNNFISSFSFCEDDILFLIGENKYNSDFQNGKYIFNVTKKHLDFITGERSACNRMELEMYNN